MQDGDFEQQTAQYAGTGTAATQTSSYGIHTCMADGARFAQA